MLAGLPLIQLVVAISASFGLTKPFWDENLSNSLPFCWLSDLWSWTGFSVFKRPSAIFPTGAWI